MTKLGSPLGVCAIVDNLDEGVIVADLVRIRAQKINSKYLCYQLNSPSTSDFINSKQKGTTRPRIQLSVVRELPIYAPSSAEQHRIVAILDEAFAGIATAKANAEKNLQNAHGIFESKLQAVFSQRANGWDQTTLGAVAEFKNGLNFTRRSKGQKVRIVGVGDFQELSVVPIDSLQTVTMDGEIGDD